MARREVQETAQRVGDAFGLRTFTTAQAAAQGIAAHRLRAAVSGGLVVRLHRGHYRLAPARNEFVGHTDVHMSTELSCEDEARLMYGIQRLGQLGVAASVGERSSAALWHLPLWGVSLPRRPLLMVPRDSGVRRGLLGSVTIIERNFPQRHLIKAPSGYSSESIPSVDPLGAALQIAARPELTTAARLSMIHSGLRRQLQVSEKIPEHDVRTLAELLAEPRVGRALLAQAEARAERMDIRGRKRVLAAIALADPRVETVLESISWVEFNERGMDLPEPQAWVSGASGRRWRVDFLFEGRVIGECDGALKYADPKALWREKKRQEDLENAGFIVVRWTWEEITHHPEVVIARIWTALARAA